MANNLTASQRLAFSQGSYDLAKLPKVGEIDDGLGTVVDVSRLINKFGQTRVVLYNLNPANPGDWVFPALAWQVMNDDGYFSPKRASSIWGSKVPQEFKMRLRVKDLIEDPTGATTIADDTFEIVEVNLLGSEAVVVGIVPLARHWAKLWALSEVDAIDWDGHAETTTML